MSQRRAQRARIHALKVRGGRFAAGAVAATATAVFAGDAQAASFEVSNLNNSGPGSLRDAVDQANADATADTITFQSGLTGTIDLTTAAINIDAALDIQGPGAGTISVSGTDTYGVFYIDPDTTGAAGDAVSISGLTLTHGSDSYGGAIHAIHTALTVTDSVLTDNHVTSDGGAIWAQGYSFSASGLTVDQNTSAHYGGGIALTAITGGATITGSQITNNTADGFGGGISSYDADSNIDIETSTISGNTATASDGGGIWFEDTYNGYSTTVRSSTLYDNTAGTGGGGVSFGENFYGPTQVIDSTVTGNHAAVGGGVSFAYRGSSGAIAPGTFEVDNSTITGNDASDTGGGIFQGYGAYSSNSSYSPVTVSSSIVSGNSATNSGPDIGTGPNASGTVTLGNSLLQDTSGVMYTESPPGSNIIGSDPQLGALGDNGGPTQTELPDSTSPVIDAGLSNGLFADQRGLARTADDPSTPQTHGSDHTDMGAVELQFASAGGGSTAAAPIVTSLTPTSGPAGASVVIHGDNFGQATSVLFGGTPATFVVNGINQITAVAPAGPQGAVDVTVVSPQGSSGVTAGDRFTYVAAAQPTQPNPGPAKPSCPYVPSLKHRTVHGARKVLARVGCNVPLKIGRFVPLSKHKRRRVVGQSPAVGTSTNDAVKIDLGYRKKL